MTDPPRRPRSDDPIDILLVEDNPGDVRLIEEAFETTASRTRFHTAATKDEAVAFLDRWRAGTAGPLPDLAIVDLNLPRRDGCDVLDAIREDPQLQHTPVIMLTSSDDRKDIVRCYDATANAYLTKPTGVDEFAGLAAAIERFWFEQAQLPPTP